MVAKDLFSEISNLVRCKECAAMVNIQVTEDGKSVNIQCLGRCTEDKIRTGLNGKSFYSAIITSGANFTGTKSLFNRAGIQLPNGKSGFYDFQKRKFIPWITEKRNEHLNDACRKLRGSSIKISTDARWPTARNALEGTVTCFWHPPDGSRKIIIELQHIGTWLFAECFIHYFTQITQV